jgi:hypothetical protein
VSQINHGFETRSFPDSLAATHRGFTFYVADPIAPFTDNTDEEMIEEELSGGIIGAAMDVLNQLRPGLDDPAAAGL